MVMSDKKLYNIYGKKQLNEKLREEPFKRITCSFYNYFEIASPEDMRDPLYHEFEKINVLGNERISKETIIIFGEIDLNDDFDDNILNNILKNLFT